MTKTDKCNLSSLKETGAPLVLEETAFTRPKADSEVEDLLNRWNNLSTVQQKTFSSLCGELDIVSDHIEKHTGLLSENFTSIVSSAHSQTENIDSIVEAASFITDNENEKSLPNLIKYLDHTLDDGITKIINLAKQSLEMVFKLEGVIDSVKEADELVKKIEDINRKTNLLALNAKIESTRAGEAGLGFAVVSDEMKDLSNTVNTVARDIQIKMSDVSVGIQDTFEELKEIATIDMSNNITAKAHIDDMLNDMMAYNHEFNDRLKSSAQMSDKIGEDISGLITGLQFQDRATQYLHSIKATLSTLDKAIADEQILNGIEDAQINLEDSRVKAWLDEIINAFPLQEVKVRFIDSLDGKDTAQQFSVVDDGDEEDDIELF